MNIFYLDQNPQICASYHHDVHVRKMIIESAQILSGAIFNIFSISKYYRPTHLNHPVVKWAGSSVQNYQYTLDLLGALLDEFSYRFDKIHKTSIIYDRIIKDNVVDDLKSHLKIEWTDPPLCMPDNFKGATALESYRAYYKGSKQFDKNNKFMAHYTKRQTPEFMR